MQMKIDQIRAESQSQLRVKKDECYRELELEEDRLRQRFLTNLKELRESKDVFSKMDAEAIKVQVQQRLHITK